MSAISFADLKCSILKVCNNYDLLIWEVAFGGEDDIYDYS
jgi:hypothetical protein